MQKTTISITLLSLALGVSLWLNLRHHAGRDNTPTADTTHLTIIDTLRYTTPAATAERPLKTITAQLPLVPRGGSRGGEVPFAAQKNGTDVGIVAAKSSSPHNRMEQIQPPDSATVEIPITQRIYQDSTYTAYLSGYQPTLDSIHIYAPRHITTIRPRPKTTRWSIGISLGYAITPHKPSPYIGVGIHYRLF